MNYNKDAIWTAFSNLMSAYGRDFTLSISDVSKDGKQKFEVTVKYFTEVGRAVANRAVSSLETEFKSISAATESDEDRAKIMSDDSEKVLDIKLVDATNGASEVPAETSHTEDLSEKTETTGSERPTNQIEMPDPYSVHMQNALQSFFSNSDTLAYEKFIAQMLTASVNKKLLEDGVQMEEMPSSVDETWLETMKIGVGLELTCEYGEMLKPSAFKNAVDELCLHIGQQIDAGAKIYKGSVRVLFRPIDKFGTAAMTPLYGEPPPEPENGQSKQENKENETNE